MTDSQRVKIGVGDFFMPRALLEQTRATSNPLLAESAERARRMPRRMALFMFEALLVLGGGYTLLHQGSAFNRPELYRVYLLALAFLLLRYQLLRGDCVGHLSDLAQERLRDRLPRLTREDVFLHHFLRYGRQYQALGGLVAVFVAVSAYSLKTGEGDWRQASHYSPTILCLNLVLMTWMAAAAQHVFEWRMRAGAPPSWFWAVATWGVSLVLAALTLVFALIPFTLLVKGHPTAALLATGAFFAAAVWLAYRTGNNVYNGALEIVRRRLREGDAEAPLGQRSRVGANDIMFPWRWRFRLTAEQRATASEASLTSTPEFASCLILTALFGGLFLLGNEAFRYYFLVYREKGAYAFDIHILYRLPLAMFAFFIAYRLALAVRRGGVPSLQNFFLANGRMIGLFAAVVALAQFLYRLKYDAGLHLKPEHYQWANFLERTIINASDKVIYYLDDLSIWCVFVAAALYTMSVLCRRWLFGGALLATAFAGLVGFGRAAGSEYYQMIALDFTVNMEDAEGFSAVIQTHQAGSIVFSWIMLVIACEALRFVLLRLGRTEAAPPVGAKAPQVQTVSES